MIDPTRAYHIADGGYFDNFGVMTAVDFIREILPAIADVKNPARVLPIEIRAGDSTTRAPARAGGFRMEVLGPIDTLMAVRTTSQLERNNVALQLLRQASGSGLVVLPSAVFELRTEVPLSWNLARNEEQRICWYWRAQCDHNRRALLQVAEFLDTSTKSGPESDLQPLCGDSAAPFPAGLACGFF